MRSLAAITLHDPSNTNRGPELDLDVTKRNVRAILIAGDQVGTPGIPAPGAPVALDIIEADLKARFPPGGIAIARLAGRPTKQLVTNAFEAMKPLIRSEELFVVMFAGHGQPATRAQHAQAWCLTGDEVFTDVDLATTLLELPARVDTVVISDCCYGEGLFRVDDLGSRRSERLRNTPMVCISGAGKNNQVELSRLGNLARETVAMAAAGQSYRRLSDVFAAKAVAGSTFHVDARPASRLDDLVLSTAVRVRERTLMEQTPTVLPTR